MSIIGAALAGGLSDGMRVYGQQMIEQERIEAQKQELAAKLKAQRDDLLLRLAAAEKEGRLNRDADVEKARLQYGSRFEARPDLYGADSTPTDRSKFERVEYERTDNSEYSDAVSRKNAPLKEKKVFDEAGYNKAEGERVQRNINRRVQVDMPDKYDNQQKGRSREIANDVFARSPTSTDAAAAMLTADGKERFKQSSGGESIIDVALGSQRTTDIGRSEITRNNRAPSGGAGGVKVNSVKDVDGRSVIVFSDGTTKDIGPSSKVNEQIAKIIAQRSKDDFVFRRLSIEEQRAIALEILGRGGVPDNRPSPAAPGPAAPKPAAAPGAKKDFSSLW